MKKLTLAVIVFFILSIGTLFTLNQLYPPVTNESTAGSTVTLTSYTLEEVATHSSEEDCYLVVGTNVYDVSNYKDEHPGGVKNITDRCGTEVTGIFTSIHSNRAWDLLGDYVIGEVVKN